MNQKVLLIMPNFFDYPQAICAELNNMGYEVDYFDDRPSTKGIVKALIRINRNIISYYIKRYFSRVMSHIQEKEYNFVILISGQSLSFSKEMILQIKESQKNAKFILYQWDSLKNFPYIKQMQHFFDICYSFDSEDVKNNPELHFLPLFYTQRYRKIGQIEDNAFKYDFCFIGTAHPKKYKLIKRMSDQLDITYPKQFIYFYFPSYLVYFYRKLMNKEFKNAHWKEFHFKPLSGDELDKIYYQTRCVLDSAQEGQSGLTIRILEALGSKKKIITTNENVKFYDFYCEQNIYIYTGEKFDLHSPFFTKGYLNLPEQIYNKYSLNNWLSTILNLREYDEY